MVIDIIVITSSIIQPSLCNEISMVLCQYKSLLAFDGFSVYSILHLQLYYFPHHISHRKFTFFSVLLHTFPSWLFELYWLTTCGHFSAIIFDFDKFLWDFPSKFNSTKSIHEFNIFLFLFFFFTIFDNPNQYYRVTKFLW